MPSFRKKPVVIVAHRIGDDGWPDEIWEGVIRNEIMLHMDESPKHVIIKTLEGSMRGDVGDYIIRGVKNEFYPCKPDIFIATYDAVENPAPSSDDAPLRSLTIDEQKIMHQALRRSVKVINSGDDAPLPAPKEGKRCLGD